MGSVINASRQKPEDLSDNPAVQWWFHIAPWMVLTPPAVAGPPHPLAPNAIVGIAPSVVALDLAVAAARVPQRRARGEAELPEAAEDRCLGVFTGSGVNGDIQRLLDILDAA
jgi:hypothetical protein